jgi:GT2 family glycosyltransferase
LQTCVPTKDISFVILTWNSAKHIGACIESIFADLDCKEHSCEIFVVDNGSADGTVALIEEMRRKRDSCLIPICLEKNTGTTYSRNLALKRAKGRYICIMDSDVVLQKGALRGLIQVLENESSAGLVVPKLVYPDGRWQKSTDNFPTAFTKIRRYFWLRKIEKQESKVSKTENPVPVDYAISAFWVLKREVLEKIGLLDENIFYAPEDVDYCLRIWLGGYQVLYSARNQVTHDAQEISRNWKLNLSTIRHIKGLLYYFRKHRYIFRKPLVQV